MKNQKNRTRKKLLIVYVSEKEHEFIKIKMKKSGIENFSQYARKILIDGQIINFKSSTELQQLVYEINKIGVNINQLTRLANENHSISKSMINEIIKLQEDLEYLVNTKVGKIFGYN